ncbi:interleukin 15, like isoform X2 [Scophthalmus maximus]|uniref:Interleukin n=1 Tax=Scophthalmus maximus TaxID=52904 RepID=A0A8D2ZT83_SCOMX|nr:interleukin 15, like isoform X2 [Scophthalmus maximus]
MLRGRPALVMVILCQVCLLAPKSAAGLRSLDVIKRVQLLIREAPKKVSLKSRLYTPTMADFQNCPSSTLKCFAAEVKVLDDEWKTRRLNVSHMLEVLAASFNQAESGCRQCECFDEETAEEFLKVLLSTLQNANSL